MLLCLARLSHARVLTGDTSLKEGPDALSKGTSHTGQVDQSPHLLCQQAAQLGSPGMTHQNEPAGVTEGAQSAVLGTHIQQLQPSK